MEKLISITIPTYNNHKSLSFALASLIAQTYENWEAIIVDDGSDPPIRNIVEQFNDPRLRLIEHPKNLGRPYARQTALDASKGDFLAMLDADDWYYPNKLSEQIKILETEDNLVVLSAGMAIQNKYGEMIGKRSVINKEKSLFIYYPQRKLAPPNIPHAPSLIQMEIAKMYIYNRNLSSSEDAEFLLKITRNYPYAHFNKILYVYSEFDSISAWKVANAYRYNAKMYASFLRQYPLQTYTQMIKVYSKFFLYYLLFKIGLGNKAVKLRSNSASSTDINTFHDAKQQVKLQLNSFH